MVNPQCRDIFWENQCRQWVDTHVDPVVVFILARVPLLIPTAFFLLYIFSTNFYTLLHYWVIHFFNYSLFQGYTELPVILRPPIPNTTSPYWMTLHRLGEILKPGPNTVFFLGVYFYILLAGPWVLPGSWIAFLFRLCVYIPFTHGIPFCLAIWFLRSGLSALKALTIWSLKCALYCIRSLWNEWRDYLWLLPVAFILWVIVTSPLGQITQNFLDAILFCLGNIFYSLGDAVRALMGLPFSSFEPGVVVRSAKQYSDASTQTEDYLINL